MGDIIDKANDDHALWLTNQISKAARIAPDNDIIDCDECGKSIGAARKRAVPSAVCCIQCQNQREQKAKRGQR